MLLTLLQSAGGVGVELIYVVDEDVSSVETTLRITGLRRVVSETLTVVEGLLTRTASQLVRVINETQSLVETRAQLRGLLRVVSEVVQGAETLAARRGLRRVVNETEQAVETVRRPMTLRRALSEAQTILEQARSTRQLRRVISEAESVADALATSRALRRLILDILEMPETTRVLVVSPSTVPLENLPITLGTTAGFVRLTASGFIVTLRGNGVVVTV